MTGHTKAIISLQILPTIKIQKRIFFANIPVILRKDKIWKEQQGEQESLIDKEIVLVLELVAT